MTNKATLAFYVDDFKKWRRENYTDEQIAKNAVDEPSYPKWNNLGNFFGQLIDTNQISLLDKEDKINLLYLIARDWDTAYLLSDLSENKPISSRGNLTDEDFIDLAKVAVTLTDMEYEDAKSQIALCFRKLTT